MVAQAEEPGKQRQSRTVRTRLSWSVLWFPSRALHASGRTTSTRPTFARSRIGHIDIRGQDDVRCALRADSMKEEQGRVLLDNSSRGGWPTFSASPQRRGYYLEIG